MEKMHLDPEGSKTIQLTGGGGHSLKGNQSSGKVHSLENLDKIMKEVYGPALKKDLNRPMFQAHYWNTYQSQVPTNIETAKDQLMAALLADPPEGMNAQTFRIQLSAPELDWVDECEIVYAVCQITVGCNAATIEATLRQGEAELERWGGDLSKITWDISW